MSHRILADKYNHLKSFGISGIQLPAGLEALCCEFYNPGTEKGYNSKGEDATFTSMLDPIKTQINVFGLPDSYWRVLICKVGEWVFLPHGMYIFTVPSGSKAYTLIRNHGDEMFKGNKLPSRPEAAKVRSFGGLS